MAALSANAQVAVKAELDTAIIMIGEQAHVKLSVTLNNNNHNTQFPQLESRQMITNSIEVIEAQPLCDTVKNDNGNLTLSKTYTITTFDDSVHYLPPFQVKVDGKTYNTNNLALKVLTLDVDTLHPNQFFPPKTVQDNPFQWSEWKVPFWLSVLVLLLMAVVIYLYIRLRDNKPVIAKIRFVRRIPPHQKALNAIQKIKNESSDAVDNQKEYYTRLTDTLRTYLQDRFGINAMEMTSGEIVEKLKDVGDAEKYAELKQLLETADLVKFAKFSTLLNEKDRDMNSVVEFIQNTKIEGEPTVERIVPKLTEKEKRGKMARLAIISAITIAALLALSLIVFIIAQIASLVGWV